MLSAMHSLYAGGFKYELYETEPKFMISGWVPGRFESNQMRKGEG